MTYQANNALDALYNLSLTTCLIWDEEELASESMLDVPIEHARAHCLEHELVDELLYETFSADFGQGDYMAAYEAANTWLLHLSVTGRGEDIEERVSVILQSIRRRARRALESGLDDHEPSATYPHEATYKADLADRLLRHLAVA